MKSTIFALATILSFVGFASAQTQLTFKTDTTATAKLGFSKKNAWSLPLKDSVIVQVFDFYSPKNKGSSLAMSFYNMPVIVPDRKHTMPVLITESKHTMPIYVPDTAVTYKKRIFSID